MDPALIGLIGIAVLIVIFLLGVPVGFAMALVGVIGFSIIKNHEAGLDMLARDFWSTWSSYGLTVIPMFVLMGSVAYYAGMGGRLYAGAYTIFGRLRGGLAMATVVATAGFSAICGSTSATAAAMGKVAIPEMRGHGYDSGLACGCTAAAGGLGILIPPSTIFIIYGILTEQSIGKLFVAGVIPGLILAGLFIFAVWLWTRFKPTSAPAGGRTTAKEKIQGLIGILEMLLLFAIVVGGLFAGLFSPTQAAGVATATAILIGVVRRQLSIRDFWLSIKDTLLITAMIMTIVAGATVFGHFMAVTGIPRAAASPVLVPGVLTRTCASANTCSRRSTGMRRPLPVRNTSDSPSPSRREGDETPRARLSMASLTSGERAMRNTVAGRRRSTPSAAATRPFRVSNPREGGQSIKI